MWLLKSTEESITLLGRTMAPHKLDADQRTRGVDIIIHSDNGDRLQRAVSEDKILEIMS